MLSDNSDFSVLNFSCIHRARHFNRMRRGGVAIHIHDTLPFSECIVDTPLQACAVTTKLHNVMTICSIYSSRNHTLSEPLLQHLLQQLPTPVLLLGNFNSYDIIWGSETTNARGKIIEYFITNAHLNLLYSEKPTIVAYPTETAIDLSICSPKLQINMEWSVHPSPGDSDDCPIIITVPGTDPRETLERRN